MRILVVGWLLYVLSWFLPVFTEFYRPLERKELFLGYGAFLLLLEVNIEIFMDVTKEGIKEITSVKEFIMLALYILSPLTNLIMLATIIPIVKKSANLAKKISIFILISGIFNLWWIFIYGEKEPFMGYLFIGYYIWVLSFFMVAWALPRISRKLKPQP